MMQPDMGAAPDELTVPPVAGRPLFRRLLADAVRVFFGQTAATAATIVAGVVIVRTVGPTGKGSLAFAATIVTLLTTAFSGVTTGAVIAIARGHAKRSQAENATLRAALIAGGAAALVLVPLGLLTHRPALMWAAAAAAPALVTGAAVMLLQYRRRIGRAIGVQQIASTGAAFAGAAVVLLGGGVAGAFACWVAALAVAALVGRHRLGEGPVIERAGGDAAVMRIGVTTTLLAVVAYLNLTIDVYIVAGTRTAVDLGIYTLGIASGQMLWDLGRSLVWPALGPIADLPREDAVLLVTRLFRQIVAVVGVAAIAAWFVGPLAIRLVYGERFAGSAEILRTILPGIVAMAAELPLGSFVLLALGEARALLALQIASMLTCGAMCLIALPRFGLVAAAFTTSATYCAVFTVVLVLALRGGVSIRALVSLRKPRA
jgi:O-antigen/teichoic acid export membrane protein